MVALYCVLVEVVVIVLVDRGPRVSIIVFVVVVIVVWLPTTNL